MWKNFNVTRVSLGKKIRVKKFAQSMYGRQRRTFCLGANFWLYGMTKFVPLFLRCENESVLHTLNVYIYTQCSMHNDGVVNNNTTCIHYYSLTLTVAAYEVKAWLLYYSPVVLKDILNEEFFQHHLLLVEGVYLLLMNTVTEKRIKQSARLLQHYYIKFVALYGMLL